MMPAQLKPGMKSSHRIGRSQLAQSSTVSTVPQSSEGIRLDQSKLPSNMEPMVSHHPESQFEKPSNAV